MNTNTKMSQAAWIVFLSLLLCIQSASAEGRRIIIKLRTGQELRGELLSTREKSLVVIIINDVSDRELTDHPEFIAAVTQKDIQKVTVKGKSNVLRWMGIGLLVGTVGGGIIGVFEGKDNEPIVNAFVRPIVVVGSALTFGLFGLLFGTIIGAGSSKGNEEINAESLQDLFLFRQYARYQKDEPECLKAFGR